MEKALSLRSWFWNKFKNLPHPMNGLASLVSDLSLIPEIDDWYLGIFRSLPSRPWSTPEPSSPTTSLLPRRERQPLRQPQLPLAPTWQDSTTRRQRPLNHPCPPHRYVQCNKMFIMLTFLTTDRVKDQPDNFRLVPKAERLIFLKICHILMRLMHHIFYGV